MCIPGTQLNIHEDKRMKPENWIPLGWLPIINAEKSRRPKQGYEGSAARNCRLFHECWKRFLSNWNMFSTVHRIVIYADVIARETMHFIAALLGDQQVDQTTLLILLMLLMRVIILISLIVLRKEINGRLNQLPPAIAALSLRSNSLIQIVR